MTYLEQWWCPTCGWCWMVGDPAFDGQHFDDGEGAPCPDRAIPPDQWDSEE